MIQLRCIQLFILSVHWLAVLVTFSNFPCLSCFPLIQQLFYFSELLCYFLSLLQSCLRIHKSLCQLLIVLLHFGFSLGYFYTLPAAWPTKGQMAKSAFAVD